MEINKQIQLHNERLTIKKNDQEMVKEDILITNTITTMMKQCGIKQGNVTAKHLKYTNENDIHKSNIYHITIKLNDYILNNTIDNEQLKSIHSKNSNGQKNSTSQNDRRKSNYSSEKLINPFDVDLSNATNGKYLKAIEITEYGALCLGSEFIRGSLPQLQSLDLSNCMIKNRGFGRLLHGLRIGKVFQITELILKGNALIPRSLNYLNNAFDFNVFSNLKVLDLAKNELCDEGADIIMRMLIKGTFFNLTLLRLDYNDIGDLGFVKIVKTLQTLHSKKCPNLDRCHLENNKVSSECRRTNVPLPPCVSV